MSDTIDLVFSFDTTGSMSSCIRQVRRYVDQTTRELFSLIPGIRIGIISHGDYCDDDLCITSLDLTDDKRKVVQFINTAPDTYGGDAAECYELVLNVARSMTWKSRRNKALVLIGDDIPHPVGYRFDGRRNDLDWSNEAELLVEAGIQILPVQALGRWHANKFYDKLASISGTPKLELPQFSDITDMVMAICHARAGTLTHFEETLRERHKPASWHVMANIDRLAGRPTRTRPKASHVDTLFEERTKAASKRSSGGGDTYMGFKAMADSGKRLIGVHPSRFQVLDIGPVDCSINDFVRSQGLQFKKGRGFYEFTKPETIQAYKEVILEDPATGRFFTGNKARVIAGLPIGEKGKFTPNPTEYTVFVQSTSANRRLKANTRFLYELPDAPEEAPEPATAAAKGYKEGHFKTGVDRAASRGYKPGKTGGPRCGICGVSGHNRRTCPDR